MLNQVFVVLVAASVLTAAFTGTMPRVSEAGMASAKSAVELAISLAGQMTLWLGFMGVLREAGLMRALSRGLRPIMTRIFPEVPVDHPAMGAMIMNIAANILGLGNAATPFGLKAMTELDTLNPRKGVATNAMALFLAINNSGVAVLPLGVVAMRAAMGSRDAAGIVVPSLLGTMLHTVVAVVLAKLLERWWTSAGDAPAADAPTGPSTGPSEAALKQAEALTVERPWAGAPTLLVIGTVVVALGWALVRHVARAPAGTPPLELTRGLLSDWLLPVLMLTIVLVGSGKRVKVYEAFITSAKEGFQVATSIIPFMVAILVAIGMFRASGAMDAIASAVGPATRALGFPPEALPMALIRPLSGSGAMAVMTDTMKAFGPDSFVGYLVSLINGSSETTFYVLALYFGSVQVRAVRHTLAVCLLTDLVGLFITTAICHAFFGGAPLSLVPALSTP